MLAKRQLRSREEERRSKGSCKNVLFVLYVVREPPPLLYNLFWYLIVYGTKYIVLYQLKLLLYPPDKTNS